MSDPNRPDPEIDSYTNSAGERWLVVRAGDGGALQDNDLEKFDQAYNALKSADDEVEDDG